MKETQLKNLSFRRRMGIIFLILMESCQCRSEEKWVLHELQMWVNLEATKVEIQTIRQALNKVALQVIGTAH